MIVYMEISKASAALIKVRRRSWKVKSTLDHAMTFRICGRGSTKCPVFPSPGNTYSELLPNNQNNKKSRGGGGGGGGGGARGGGAAGGGRRPAGARAARGR